MPERILIVGLGNIGRRHLSVVHEVLPDAGIVVLRRPGGDLNGLAVHGVTLVHDVDAAAAADPDRLREMAAAAGAVYAAKHTWRKRVRIIDEALNG